MSCNTAHDRFPDNPQKCKACSYATHNTDKFFVATLPLPPRRQFPSLTPISLEECFALSEKSESINTWTCDKCKRLDATNCSLVVSHPRILILHLARFEYVAGANARRKRGDEILIPAKISRPGASGQPARES
jgi:ubiquitin C-terminal hydrolase